VFLYSVRHQGPPEDSDVWTTLAPLEAVINRAGVPRMTRWSQAGSRACTLRATSCECGTLANNRTPRNGELRALAPHIFTCQSGWPGTSAIRQMIGIEPNIPSVMDRACAALSLARFALLILPSFVVHILEAHAPLLASTFSRTFLQASSVPPVPRVPPPALKSATEAMGLLPGRPQQSLPGSWLVLESLFPKFL
jgi:hypothetical protein